MPEDPIATFERELVTAARRRARVVKAVQIDRRANVPIPMIWYAADGDVVKRIGQPSR